MVAVNSGGKRREGKRGGGGGGQHIALLFASPHSIHLIISDQTV
jgi:hypothetical protein